MAFQVLHGRLRFKDPGARRVYISVQSCDFLIEVGFQILQLFINVRFKFRLELGLKLL